MKHRAAIAMLVMFVVFGCNDVSKLNTTTYMVLDFIAKGGCTGNYVSPNGSFSIFIPPICLSTPLRWEGSQFTIDDTTETEYGQTTVTVTGTVDLATGTIKTLSARYERNGADGNYSESGSFEATNLSQLKAEDGGYMYSYYGNELQGHVTSVNYSYYMYDATRDVTNTIDCDSFEYDPDYQPTLDLELLYKPNC
jgi:hypothetical protein